VSYFKIKARVASAPARRSVSAQLGGRVRRVGERDGRRVGVQQRGGRRRQAAREAAETAAQRQEEAEAERILGRRRGGNGRGGRGRNRYISLKDRKLIIIEISERY